MQTVRSAWPTLACGLIVVLAVICSVQCSSSAHAESKPVPSKQEAATQTSSVTDVADAAPPNASQVGDPVPHKIGLWLEVAGTALTLDAATMNVNLQLSATPSNGKFWQGYRKNWVNPVLPDLCKGDVVVLHMSCGQVPGMPYRLQEFDTAATVCPMLVNWTDYIVAWSNMPGGVEFVPYIGSPALVGSGLAGSYSLQRYLAPFDQLKVRVAFDASAMMGNPDPYIHSVLMDYHRKHGILVEPWIPSSQLSQAAGVGIVCATAERARWLADPGGWPVWFPPKNVIKRPIWFAINDLPDTWYQMDDTARRKWMTKRAIEIALDGDVPLIPMGQAASIKDFNAYFNRKPNAGQ